MKRLNFTAMSFSKLGFFAASLVLFAAARAEDGYRLWLRYDLIADESQRHAYADALTEIVAPDSPRFGIGPAGPSVMNLSVPT